MTMQEHEYLPHINKGVVGCKFKGTPKTAVSSWRAQRSRCLRTRPQSSWTGFWSCVRAALQHWLTMVSKPMFTCKEEIISEKPWLLWSEIMSVMPIPLSPFSGHSIPNILRCVTAASMLRQCCVNPASMRQCGLTHHFKH